MSKSRRDDTFVVGMVILFIIGGLFVWIGRGYMEASAYNRVTGADLSTWDALWIDLRVQEAPR